MYKYQLTFKKNEMTDQNLLQRIMNFQNEEIEILKTKAAYGYNYSPLEQILPIVLPKLKEYGLGYYHITGYCLESKQNYLKTVLFNIDDTSQTLESRTNIDEKVKLAKMNEFMVLGSAMTYFRRYHLVVMLGLTTDEDSDAGGAIPDADKEKVKPQGRSVESNAKQNEDLNFVAIFQNLIDKGNSRDSITKTFENYRKIMKAEDLQKVADLIKNKFT